MPRSQQHPHQIFPVEAVGIHRSRVSAVAEYNDPVQVLGHMIDGIAHIDHGYIFFFQLVNENGQPPEVCLHIGVSDLVQHNDVFACIDELCDLNEMSFKGG